MIERKEFEETKIYTAIICDKCGMRAEFSGDSEYEAQEFVSLRGMGGYGSRHIGDMAEWELDLCQDCFEELCGQYLRFVNLVD